MPEEVLLLWDRILGFDSLDVLPILAVAILSFRKTELMTCTAKADAEALVKDLRSFKVCPMLQFSLFGLN